MRSASNGGVTQAPLPRALLHINIILFIATLGASHMVQPDIGQHEDRVAVREAAYHTSTTAGLPVQPLNHIIGTNTGLVLTGKIRRG